MRPNTRRRLFFGLALTAALGAVYVPCAGPVLAAMVLAQAPKDLTVAGEVVDEQGKPIGLIDIQDLVVLKMLDFEPDT